MLGLVEFVAAHGYDEQRQTSNESLARGEERSPARRDHTRSESAATAEAAALRLDQSVAGTTSTAMIASSR